MTTEELHWLAGWLEGEGSFLRGSPSKPNSCRITAGITDKDIAEKVGKIFGTKAILVKKEFIL